MDHRYLIILAGGDGTRLWPLSNKKRPKQLIPFIHHKSLLTLTLDRIQALAIPTDQMIIVTSQDHYESIKELTKDRVGTILVEPCPRNTAPAILMSCRYLIDKDPYAVALFLPSDHFIPDEQSFVATMHAMYQTAEQEKQLILAGIKPTYAATGYGYIKTDHTTNNVKKIISFHEKPNKEIAREYLMQDTMLWNVGIFGGLATSFLTAFITHAPAMVSSMNHYLTFGTGYENIPAISIDYAIMEKISTALVLPCSFVWYDVGNLFTFLSLQKLFNKELASVITIQGKNNLISSSKKIVACIGVSNLCIVETEDSLLIVSQDQVEQVKTIFSTVRNLE